MTRLNLPKILFLGIGLTLSLNSTSFGKESFPIESTQNQKVRDRYTPTNSQNKNFYDKNFLKFTEIYNLIEANHIGADPEKLQEATTKAIKTFTETLDPHSEYFDAVEDTSFQQSLNGEYVGIGIKFVKDSTEIEDVYPDGPAEKEGLKPKDKIIAVDSVPVETLKPEDIISKIMGEKGTPVTLTLKRESTEFTKTLIRSIIKTKNVESFIENKIATLKLHTFSKTASEDLRKSIKLLEDQKDNPYAYILDLRDNPGGYLEQAILLSDLFLEKGNITHLANNTGKIERSYTATPGDILKNKPLILLINENSASASEIVAAALQENKRALLFGRNSFGKGSVQSIIDLAYGGSLKITTSYYLTPSEKTLQNEGVTPDIFIPEGVFKENTETHLQEKNLKNTLKTPNSLKKPVASEDHALPKNLQLDNDWVMAYTVLKAKQKSQTF